MAVNASPVAGTLFKYTVGSPGTLTLVPGLTNVAYSSGDKTDIDVTSIDDLVEVFIPGRKAAKELGFQMFYDAANAAQQALLAAYNGSVTTGVPCSFTEPDSGAAVDTFSAYVKNMNKKYDVNGAIAYDVTMKLTTVITTTP